MVVQVLHDLFCFIACFILLVIAPLTCFRHLTLVHIPKRRFFRDFQFRRFPVPVGRVRISAIDQANKRFAIGHFLLVVHCN